MRLAFPSTCIAGLALLLVATGPAAAVPIIQGFEVTAANGPLVGQTFTGTFSYDNSLLTGSGTEYIDPTQGLTVSFTFGGITYTQVNDLNYPDYPLAAFVNGDLAHLDFLVDNLFELNAFFSYFVAGNGYFGDVSYTGPVSVAVAEPGLLALLGTGLLLLGVAAPRARRTGAVISRAAA